MASVVNERVALRPSFYKSDGAAIHLTRNAIALDRLLRLMFTSGETGFAFVADDVTSVFQTSDGALPAKPQGHPVGMMKDVSGNGVNATQPTLNKRPTFSGSPNHIKYESDENLSVTIASAMAGCTVLQSSLRSSLSVLENQNIGAGTIQVYPERAILVIDRLLTTDERAVLKAAMRTPVIDISMWQLDGRNTAWTKTDTDLMWQ